MAQVTILLFAILKDKIGKPRFELELPDGSTIRDLKTKLGEEFPQAKHFLGTTLVSVNKEFAFDDDLVPAGAEIGLFPPVSGGSEPVTIVQITPELIDLNALLEKITNSSNGAACIFTGMVRGMTTRGHAHQTDVLFYEAYNEMAEQKMRQVAEEIRSRWPAVDGIAIIQRVGRLEPMTPTIMIACTAAHRDTGVFEAARYGIDRLKQIVPVWKKEIGPEGEKWIEGDYTPGKADQ